MAHVHSSVFLSSTVNLLEQSSSTQRTWVKEVGGGTVAER